jgi:hypothetical protein
MDLFDLTPLLGIPAVVKVIDAYRQAVIEQEWRKFAFTVGSWVLGFGLAALVAQTSIGVPEWNWADLVLVGVGLGSTASVVHDIAKKEPVAPVAVINAGPVPAPDEDAEPAGI